MSIDLIIIFKIVSRRAELLNNLEVIDANLLRLSEEQLPKFFCMVSLNLIETKIKKNLIVQSKHFESSLF